MKVTQVYELLNTTAKETLGESAVVNEDLSNVVDVGIQLSDPENVDKYVKKLINHIGRVIFVDRTYGGSAPNIMKEGWEYGSILQKIDSELPESQENESWNLVDGQRYDQDVFKAPKVTSKFFNSKITYEIAMSFAHRQVKQSFSSASQLNAFFSMIETKIRTRKTIDYDNLIMRTINNFIAATLYDAYGAGANYGGATHTRARNLLLEYNQMAGTDLQVNHCLTDLNFLKYATMQIMLASSRMEKISKMFNIGGRERFTPKRLQHLVTLSEFNKAADMYLQADTYHNEFVKLEKSAEIAYWQGSGTDYGFDSVSKINVTTKNPADIFSASNITVEASGILAVLFDNDAMAVCNEDDRVTSHPNQRAEFVNNWYKSDAQYYNDYNENGIVFFVANP